MASGEFKIDGYDIDNLGFEISHLPDFRAFQRRRWQAARSAMRMPHILTSNDPAYEVSPLTVVGNVTAASLSTLDDNVEKLLAACDRKDEVTIEFSNRANHYYYARWETAQTGEPTHMEFGSPSSPFVRMTLGFVLLDPFRYASSTSNVGSIQSSATDIPMGTAPTIRDLQLTITGASGATNPTITYRDQGTTTIHTTALTASIGAGQTRVLDMEAGTIVDQASANKISERNAGTSFPWFLDSRDCVFRTSSWLDLAITNTGTQMTLACQYRKAYLR